MKNSVFSQVPISKFRQIFRQELQSFFESTTLHAAHTEFKALLTIQQAANSLKQSVINVENQVVELRKEVEVWKSLSSETNNSATRLFSKQAKRLSAATWILIAGAIGGTIAWMYSFGKDNGMANSQLEIVTLTNQMNEVKKERDLHAATLRFKGKFHQLNIPNCR